MSKVLSALGVSKEYREGKGALKIFEGIDFEIGDSETVAIVGSSGAGKTTLLNILGGLDKPSQGTVLFEGEDVHRMREAAKCKLRNKHVGFVYQFHHLLPEFTTMENVCMPLLISGELSSKKQRAVEVLDKVGLSHRLDHKPSELSGGERQRVAIARALVNDPKVVLMDEPTGNLDENTAQQVQALIFDLCYQLKTSFVIVTHDLRLAKQMEKTWLLESGSLRFQHSH
jgi:lipoprotein-releasing system ATP-binding protein